ncbi:EpsG family protein [Bacteroides sp.]
MTYLIICFIIISLYKFVDKKEPLFVFVFLFAWLLMAGNCDNTDFSSYLIRYDAGTNLNLNLDFGYALLNSIFNRYFSYMEFKAIMSFIALFILFDTIAKISNHRTLVALTYLVLILPLDVIQIRFFYAFCLSFYALRFLLISSKYARYKFFVIILFASTIHLSAIFYIVLLLPKRMVKFKYIIIGVICLLIFKLTLFNTLSVLFETDKMYRYSDKISGIASSVLCILQFLNAYFFLWYFRKIKVEKTRIADFTIYLNWLFLFLIPFYLDQMIYSRLFRSMSIFNFIAISYFSYMRKGSRWPLFYILYFFFILLIYSGYYLEYVDIMFSNNIYF